MRQVSNALQYIAACVIAVVLGLGLGAVSLAADTGWDGAQMPCPTEDSLNCYWDGSQHGDGTGRSFTTDEHGTTTYDDGTVVHYGK